MTASSSSSSSSFPASTAAAALPPLTLLAYVSPSIPTLLTLASFLLLLSISSRLFSTCLPGSSPVLGPLLWGLIYGAPLSSILPPDVQRSVQSIGYLGLLLLLVEGGSETRLDVLASLRNAVLALGVGLTGIALPVVFSVAVLPPAFGYGRVESFAIGAALSSTSLGTVFAVLAQQSSDNKASTDGSCEKEAARRDQALPDAVPPTDLINTRAGTILIGAALLDDIVGLVLASVVVALPPDNAPTSAAGSPIAAWDLARPIVSCALILTLTALLCRCVLRPTIRSRKGRRFIQRGYETSSRFLSAHLQRWLPLGASDLALFAWSATVAAFATIAEVTHSSVLIGCFCAGAMLAYSAKEMECSPSERPAHEISDSTGRERADRSDSDSGLLTPFFFASIGFAIPLAQLFHGKTVWRGVIFAGLMGFAKCAAGAWILLADWIERRKEQQRAHLREISEDRGSQRGAEDREEQGSNPMTLDHVSQPTHQGGYGPEAEATTAAATVDLELRSITRHTAIFPLPTPGSPAQENKRDVPAWPAAFFVGASLISRGEIGYLIINLANNVGNASEKDGGVALLSAEAFAVGIWAITLNTLVGPLVVGIMLQSAAVREAVCRGRWGNVPRAARAAT
ncbi:hypothetical protein OC834_000044 [Tilletia horrida]|nr:hypothetical protein OC834_000044 [Tilletia horrida]